MSKGIKFLIIGCLSVLVIGTIATGVGMYLVGSWFKKKADTVGNLIGTENSEYGKKMAELKKEYPFTPRADNVITEDQLKRFLAVRKDIFQVWKDHEAELKKLSEQSNPDLGGALKTVEVLKDLRMRQASALAEQRMGPDEYRYLAQIVYITWVAKTTKDVLKDTNVSEAAEDSLKQQIESLNKQIEDPSTNEQVKEQLKTLRDQMQAQLENLEKNKPLQQVDKELEEIPQSNLDLFTKYKADIEKYSMAGLEMLLPV